MKLYVINSANQKVYLDVVASTRRELAQLIGSWNFYLGSSGYSVYDVYAENDSNNMTTGAVVGGAVGLLGGPIGVIVGGVVGGLIGNSSDESEDKQVHRFNRS